MLTTTRRLAPGRAARMGSRAAYLSIVEAEGEPHVVRGDLVGPQAAPQPRWTPLLSLVHMTDLHVMDYQSPARFEFVNREWEDPRFRELLTMQRPHEAMNTHAVHAMVRAINALEVAPLTGKPIELVSMTGDAIDNTQRNELDNVIALLNGGLVRPDSGILGYEGVQSTAWPGDFYWKPDGKRDADLFQSAFGFPRVPGLLERAVTSFESEGLRVPWLGCYGNHEEVCQGVGLVTAALARVMAGARKAYALPDAVDPDTAVETFVRSPELFATGPAFHVSADPERRPIDRREFIDALAAAGGHGFTEENRRAGTAYYVDDLPGARLITLETVCEAGGADGHIDRPQLAWLEERLQEVHSSYEARDGSVVRTSSDDRLVVILSHHGLDTMSNPRVEPSAEDMASVLHRYRNVVLWLNGHIHANRITPRPHPRGSGGYWEVTTSSIVDWPCQSRVVELFEVTGGHLAVGCTMLDHEGSELALLHRELAANVPYRGFGSWHEGGLDDRNAILLMRRPF